MATFGEKSVYELESSDAIHLKSLNERFVRWQEKQIALLTFSINLIFTLSLAAIGLIINNFDSCLFKNKYLCGCSLPKSIAFIITISAILGIAALLCRLIDFRLTKNTIRKRTFLFKVKNRIKYEHSKELIQSEIEAEIKNLTCWTKYLGCATWLFFSLQTVIFLAAILIAVCQI